MRLLLTYGSLRKDEYNYERVRNIYGQGSMTFKKQVKLEGFDMYDLGLGYPAIYPGKGVITCDLMEISDNAYLYIKYIELGSGYLEQQIEDMIIYVFSVSLDSYEKINSGDWLNRENTKQRLEN